MERNMKNGAAWLPSRAVQHSRVIICDNVTNALSVHGPVERRTTRHQLDIGKKHETHVAFALQRQSTVPMPPVQTLKQANQF